MMPFRLRLALGVYSLAMELVVWAVLVPSTVVRILARRARPSDLGERLGFASLPQRPRVLVHAVSAGEMNAAQALVARLPPTRGAVLLSTNTRAGLEVAERLASAHPQVEGCVLLPWDRRAVKSWLRSLGATAVVVVETEIWPNLFMACRALGLPLFVVSGAIHDKHVRRYRLASAFFREVLACATWIGARDERGRDAYIAIGALPSRVEVAGDLKLDATTPARLLPTVAEWLPAGVPLVVAGSTHRPEESLLIECAAALRRPGRTVRVVIAPRDVDRAVEIVRLAERQRLKPLRWSLSHGLVPAERTDWDVLVLDEYGWLTSFYDIAEVVFLGGTIAPVGGHNLAEAAVRARPVIVGPHVEGITALVERLTAGGGVLRLREGPPLPALIDACAGLLDDSDRARAIGLAARAICRQAGGAGDQCLLAIGSRMGFPVAGSCR